MRTCYFRAENGPFVLNNFFFGTNHYYRFHLPIDPFWAQNGAFPQMIIFLENPLMSLVSFIYSYLHAKNQSQMLIY